MKSLFLLSAILLLPILIEAQIDITETVKIGGINQYISIKGEDTENPVLLFLHGGPGRSVLGAAESFNDKLIGRFILVHWDQRETGKTLELNASREPLSIELLQNDTYEMIHYLLKKFNKKKLYLVSHSWGSVLGFHIAEKHPELLHAFIPISPIIDSEEHTRLTIKMLKKWAQKNDNQVALKELDSVNIPIKTKEDLFYQQKWLFIHNEVEFAMKPSFRNEFFTWMETWFPLVIKSFENNLFETVKELDCPVYFIEGNGDRQKSHWIVKKYYKRLKAKEKKFYWFTKSGHTVFNTEPDKLQQTIIEIADMQKSAANE